MNIPAHLLYSLHAHGAARVAGYVVMAAGAGVRVRAYNAECATKLNRRTVEKALDELVSVGILEAREDGKSTFYEPSILCTGYTESDNSGYVYDVHKTPEIEHLIPKPLSDIVHGVHKTDCVPSAHCASDAQDEPIVDTRDKGTKESKNSRKPLSEEDHLPAVSGPRRPRQKQPRDLLWDTLERLTIKTAAAYGASRFGAQVAALTSADAEPGELLAAVRGNYQGDLDGLEAEDFATYWHTQDWRGRGGKDPGRPPEPHEVAGEFGRYRAWKAKLKSPNGRPRGGRASPADVQLQKADELLAELDLMEAQLDHGGTNGSHGAREAESDRVGKGVGRRMETAHRPVPQLKAV